MNIHSFLVAWMAMSSVEIQTVAAQVIKRCKGYAEDPTFHLFTGNFSKCLDWGFSADWKLQNKENSCVPKDVIVELRSADGIFTPNFVTVKRCVGHCKLGNHCHVESQRPAYIPVKKKDRNDKVECGFVEVANHTNCTCGCQVTQDDCNIYQVLDPDACKCKCADHPSELGRRIQNCNEKRGKWDYDECRCKCEVKKCMPGREWASERCECVEIVQ